MFNCILLKFKFSIIDLYLLFYSKVQNIVLYFYLSSCIRALCGSYLY